MASVPPVGRDS